ncbi:hypothetical protein MTO96_052067 [Rhipicephalus appendiculatus]
MMLVLALATTRTSAGFRYRLHGGGVPICGGFGYWKHGFGGGGYGGHGYGKKINFFSHLHGKRGGKGYAHGNIIAPGGIYGFHGGYGGGYGGPGWW